MAANTRLEADKIARFVKKNEIQMKECLMPVEPLVEKKPSAHEGATKPATKQTDKKPDAKCHCGEKGTNHYYQLKNQRKAQLDEPHSLPVDGTAAVVSLDKVTLTAKQQQLSKTDWEKSNPIDKLPTNAAGKIKFLQEEGVRRISDFIRISDDTPVTVMLELFKKHWSLFTPKPSLVISILGGAKNLKMDSKISETFKSGLIMAAKSTNAWIITGGFNIGVMKLVGDAVAEWQGVQFDENGQPREAVRCIGIAPWGYIANRDSLVVPHEKESTSWKAPRHSIYGKLSNTTPLDKQQEQSYRSDRSKQKVLGGVFEYQPSNGAEHGRPVSLNPHHTHFILVDNGMRNVFDAKAVGDFRAQLENLVSEKKNGKQGDGDFYGIPVVVVLVEGGDDSIQGCAQSIKAGIPVVACEGTGRAADILAYAIQNCIRPKPESGKTEVSFSDAVLRQLREKIYKSYYEKFFRDFYKKPIDPNDKDHVLLEKVKEAYQKIKSDNLPRLLNLSNLPESMQTFCQGKIKTIVEFVKDCCVDSRLLTAFDCTSDKEDFDYAILAALANKKQTKTIDDLKEQLRLALTWNRSDIAEKNIFAHQNETFESHEVSDIIFDAILLDRVDFLQVSLSNGVVINDLLTIGMLRRLYERALADSNRNTPDANHLHRRLRLAVKSLDAAIQREISHGSIRLCAIHKLVTTLLGSNYDSTAKPQSDDPYDEYSLDEIAKRVEYNLTPEIANLPLSNPCRELFIFAVLLNRPRMAEFFWKRTDDCLCLALVAAKILHALGGTCEGHQLDLQNSYMKSKDHFEELACSLCNESYKAQPERALILVERHYEVINWTSCLEMGIAAHTQSFLSTTCCQDALDSFWKQGIRHGSLVIFLSLVFPILIPFLDIEKPGEEEGRLNPLEKTIAFYRAPVTKFLLWHLSYLMYLLLYTYILIFDFVGSPSPIEITVYLWTFTLFIDNLAEIGHMPGTTWQQRFMRWLRWSNWNPAALLAYIFHLAGVFCRFLAYGEYLLNYRGKVLLACCLWALILRFSRVFSVHSWLGPKLVMIGKMLIELGRWLVILTIFNVAFGVMRAAIMFRDDQIANYKTFDNIIYFPFWNLWNSYDSTLDPNVEYHCGENDTTTAYGQVCPEDFELLPIILSAYLIIAKILLCNLFIAILNNVYGDVQQNSLQVWKFNFFVVAKWAEWKTWLPPPIGFFFHFTPYGIFGTCKANHEATRYMYNHIEQLRIFEREMLESMTKAQMEAHRQTIEGQIKAVRESIAHVVDRVVSLRNLDFIAKRDREKSASTKKAQQNWLTAMKSIAQQKVGEGSEQRSRGGSTLRRMFGLSRPGSSSRSPSVDVAGFASFASRIKDLETGFESVEQALSSALSEMNSH